MFGIPTIARGSFLADRPLMPKPKGKTGPFKGHNKNFRHRPATKSTHEYIPESAVDREPDLEEPEDEDSTSSIEIDVPVAMWVRESTPWTPFRTYLERLGFWSLRPKTLLGEETRSPGSHEGASSGESIPWDRTIVRLSFLDVKKVLH